MPQRVPRRHTHKHRRLWSMAEGTALPGFQAIANVAASPATHVALMAASLLAQTDLFPIGVAMFGP
ncbi:hypothetical protein JH280_04385 [Xanthomonas campestris]|nr:hypothetical protein JH280_04385 [Xanthomonas campestris]